MDQLAFCPRCGTRRVSGARFCGGCGADLEGAGILPSRAAVQASMLPPAGLGPSAEIRPVVAAPQSTVPGPRRRSRVRLFAAVGLVAVVVVGAGLWWALFSSPSCPKGWPVPAGGDPAGVTVEYRVLSVGGRTPTQADLPVERAIVERRAACLSAGTPVISTRGTDRIVLELPGGQDTAAVRRAVGQAGRLDFVPIPAGQAAPGQGTSVDLATLKPLISGDQLKSASIGQDQNGNRTVNFVLKEQGKQLFADWTASHVGQFLAVTLDSVVISAPRINGAIPGGNVEISAGGIGGFPLPEAESLTVILRFGSLPYPMQEVAVRSTGSHVLTSPSTASPAPVRYGDRFVPTGPLAIARAGHAATLFLDGRVLVAGGGTANGIAATAELYDPRTGTWSPAGSMAHARAAHTATLLPDGRVLVASGGSDGNSSLASVELFDSRTGPWSTTGSLAGGRITGTAARLSDGRVLVAGGGSKTDGTPGQRPLASAELYDSRIGIWSPAGSMSVACIGRTATLLADGRVLVAGGETVGSDGLGVLTTAELFQ